MSASATHMLHCVKYKVCFFSCLHFFDHRMAEKGEIKKAQRSVIQVVCNTERVVQKYLFRGGTSVRFLYMHVHSYPFTVAEHCYVFQKVYTGTNPIPAKWVRNSMATNLFFYERCQQKNSQNSVIHLSLLSESTV